MSNFNEYIKNRGAKTIVDRFFNNTDIYNATQKITSMDFEFLEEPPQPASYYIENGLTASWKIRIKYTINDETDYRFAVFEIPKEIDGAFIIEGSYRISTNKLGSDYDCRIRMSGAGNYIINFDYDRQYDINKRVLKIKKSMMEDGISDRAVDIKYDDIDNVGEDKKPLLKLTERQSKKFQVKLNLDYKPEYITTKLIQECLAFGDDRLRDLIVDKTIESVPVGFMQFIFRSNNGRNYYSARRRITNYFTKYGKIQEDLTAITRLAYRYFKGTSEVKSGEAVLQVPPGINAVNLDSLGDKITLSKSTAYNITMSDIIDLADTPINQNTNLQNSLTVSTHVTDDGILFDVFDKDFNKITIQYLDYLNSKVVTSDFVDYENKKVKPGDNGDIVIKYRMDRKTTKADDYDLIDLPPDFRLSKTTRRIPFLNNTDSVRISMATTMLKQSIPLVNGERPLVDTGNTEELAGNILNEKFKYDEGVVKSIDENKVTIELPDGTDVDVLRRTAIQSINDVSVFTEPKVKVGQKVKKDDVITGAVGLEKDTYRFGLNTLVLFHAYFGLINEDALVVSEAYADKMTHYSVIDVNMEIKNSAALKWIAPIGTKVKFGDKIATVFKAVRLDEINRSLNEKLGGLFGEDGTDLTQYTIEDYLKVPNNIDEGYISDVLIQEMKKPVIPKSVKAPDYSFCRQSQVVIDEYNKNKDRKVIYDRFPEYVAADTLDPINMDPTKYKVVYSVRIRIIKKTGLMIGSKVTNRYGGKGVISKIVPTEMMPIMVEKGTGKQTRVEVVMNPYSTIGRKIAGVLYEGNLGLIAHKVYDLVESYKTTKTGRQKIMPLVNKFYPGRYENMSEEDFIKLHESKPIEEVYYFNVGCYTKIKPEQIEAWMDELGLESQSDILMPTEQLTDLDELRDNLSPEEYEKIVNDMKGKFTKVDKKLQCCYLVLEELFHIPSYSNKSTTSLFGVDINPKRDEPIMGRGRYRATGQKVSEMDLWCLLSRNARDFISQARGDTEKEGNQLFLNNLLGLGLTVSSNEGYNQGGSYLRENMNKMKTKFRLKKQI